MITIKHIKITLLICITCIYSFNAYSLQDSTKVKRKGKFYLGWGYNRDWYSKGNVRLVNNNPQLINGKYYTYDFTIYNAKAIDRPQFDKIYDVVKYKCNSQ